MTEKVIRRHVRGRLGGETGLSGNMIVRMVAAAARTADPHATVFATLDCVHFRRSLSHWEVGQIYALDRLLRTRADQNIPYDSEHDSRRQCPPGGKDLRRAVRPAPPDPIGAPEEAHEPAPEPDPREYPLILQRSSARMNSTNVYDVRLGGGLMTSLLSTPPPTNSGKFVDAPGSSVTANFKVMLPPWLEAGVNRQGDGRNDVLADVAAFRKKEKRLRIPPTAEAGTGLFRFEGEAARTIVGNCYIFAVADENVALPLAGSAEHALGGRPRKCPTTRSAPPRPLGRTHHGLRQAPLTNGRATRPGGRRCLRCCRTCGRRPYAPATEGWCGSRALRGGLVPRKRSCRTAVNCAEPGWPTRSPG